MLQVGNMVYLKSMKVCHATPVGEVALTYQAPRGKYLALVLLGEVDKKESNTVDPNALLNHLGWEFKGEKP